MPQIFGVKLNTDLPGSRPLHTLQQSVVRPSRGPKQRRDRIHRLVVQRVHLRLRSAQHGRHPRFRAKRDPVDRCRTTRSILLCRLWKVVLRIIDVLDESASPSHVENLHSPTDTENGETDVKSLPSPTELKGIKFAVHVPHFRMRLLSVEPRIHVGSAREDESLDRDRFRGREQEDRVSTRSRHGCSNLGHGTISTGVAPQGLPLEIVAGDGDSYLWV